MMRSLQRIVWCGWATGLSTLLLLASPHNAEAQHGMFSESLVAVNNLGTQFSYLDFSYLTSNAAAVAAATQSFTGLDGQGNTQAMTFSGETVSQANFGRLRVRTTGSVNNAYYNANNPDYSAEDGTVADPNGSPSTLTSLGFAVFNDTLQYGGPLESGYKARYIFHVDGTNSGTVAAADPVNLATGANLAVNVDNNPGEGFFAFDPGFFSANWATQTYEINGITPQHINVQFSTQVLFNLFNLTDGQDYTGQADFSSTLTLAGIEMLDRNGNPVSGWTVTSSSGTQYNTIQGTAVPEPGSVAFLLGMAAVGTGLLRKNRSRLAKGV